MKKYMLNIMSPLEKELEVSITEKQFELFKDVRNSDYCKTESNEIIVSRIFEKSKRVADVWRYTLQYSSIGEKWELQQNDQSSEKFKQSEFHDKSVQEITEATKSSKSIVIVIESPHKYEYADIKGEIFPIAPAQGKTGKNIAKLFPALVESNAVQLNIHEIYEVLIINPVPFLTSLFYIHKKPLRAYPVSSLRNKIWKALYENGCKNDLLKRLKRIKPSIIINACTVKLKGYISEDIKNQSPQICSTLYVASHHPSVWHMNNVNIDRST